MSFARAITHLLQVEGGYVNNPNDSGGETSFGISKRAYPNVDIRALTEQEAVGIYSRDYWEPLHGDSLPDAVSFALLDFAVNSGVGEAVRSLQRALYLTVDGIMGTQTIAAATRNPQMTVIGLSAERMLLLTKQKEWATFAKGWTQRVIATAMEAVL